MSKKKILIFSDSPFSTTGLARQTRYFLRMFPEFDFYMYASNHQYFNIIRGRQIPLMATDEFENIKQLMVPAKGQYDSSGVPQAIQDIKPDFLLSFVDFQHMDAIAEQIKQLSIVEGFKWIHYMNVDRYDFATFEFERMQYVDRIITSSKFGYDHLHSIGFRKPEKYIWHAIDAEEFPSVSRQQLRTTKKEYFGKDNAKKTVVGTVNRMFARKDPVRLMWIFDQFHKQNKDSLLYMHGNVVSYEKQNMAMIRHVMNLTPGSAQFRSPDYEEVSGVSQEDLNKIYRMFDIFISTSTGEGFGYSTVEALLTETPIIGPRNTTFPELIGDNGYLVDCDDWTFVYGLYSSPWPIVNKDKYVKQLQYVHDNMDEAKQKAKSGRKWVLKNLNLDTIRKQWLEIFQ